MNREQQKKFVNVLMMAGLALGCGVYSATAPEAAKVSFEVPASAAQSGRAFYVSPQGRASFSGGVNDPLDLATMLARETPARGGDTIFLRGGTYEGLFTSFLVGSPGNPIVVRPYPGERVTLTAGLRDNDKVLSVNGSNTWYWGLEIMSTGVKRRTDVAGCPSTDRGWGLWVWGSDNKFINLIVHDLCGGFGVWGKEIDGFMHGANNELYGNLIYYNGVMENSNGRGQGHGMYVNNPKNSSRVLRDNIVFANFSQGIRSGDEPNDTPLIEGNIVFQNGRHLPGQKGRNIYVGGLPETGGPVVGIVARNNLTYYDDGAFASEWEEGMNLGLWWPGASGEVTNNYIAGGNHALKFGYEDTFTPTACRGNQIYGRVSDFVKRQCPPDTNIYHDMNKPTTNHIVVRPNTYEPGRAHIAVYNWRMLPSVEVELTNTGLAQGDRFEIRDVWDYFGQPVAAGTYTGARVSIPMTGLRAAEMQGARDLPVEVQPRHTAPEFNAFVVLKR